MEAINKAVYHKHYEDEPLVASQSIRLLLVITGLATGGATNVVLDIARHFKNQPGFDVQLVPGSIPPGRQDGRYLAAELGIPTRLVTTLITHLSLHPNMD